MTSVGRARHGRTGDHRQHHLKRDPLGGMGRKNSYEMAGAMLLPVIPFPLPGVFNVTCSA
jgi:hypothetical protein